MTKVSRIATYGALIRLMVCLVVLGVGPQFSTSQGSNFPQYLPVLPAWRAGANLALNFKRLRKDSQSKLCRCTRKEETYIVLFMCPA